MCVAHLSLEMTALFKRGGRTARRHHTGILRRGVADRHTVCVMTPPNEHSSEGGRDDRGVPYHAESTLSSAQVLKVEFGGFLKEFLKYKPLSQHKERKKTEPKGGMGGRHAATTQGF